MTNVNCQDEVIDLTESFTLANHNGISNAVIELLDSDESFIKSPVVIKRKSLQKRVLQRKKEPVIKEEVPNHCPNCPICWEALGKKPLASTKCGHVFCWECLASSLKIKRECPTCRTKLNKSSSYHPIYI